MIDRLGFYESRASERPRELQRHYHRLLEEYYCFLIPRGVKVLEVGCGVGDLLAAVQPARGVGIDFSPKTVALARQRHPELEFHVGDAVDWAPRESSHAALPIASFGGFSPQAQSSRAGNGTLAVEDSGVTAESASAHKMCPIATELFPLSPRRTSAGNLDG